MNPVAELLRREQQDLHVSASALRLLEGCPRSWWYKYVASMPSEDVSSRLVLGKALHSSLAMFYTAMMDGTPEPTIEELVGVAAAGIADALADTTPVLFADGEDGHALVEEAHRLLTAFLAHGYRPKRVVGVEVPFAVALTHPETGELLPFEEKLAGAIDLVAEDDDGRLVVVDHKITGRSDAQKTSLADLQMGVYGWVAAQLFDADEVVLRYQNVLRTKTARVELKDIQRTEHEAAEAIEAVASGLELVHVAVAHREGRRLMGRRRSWRCKECQWRRRCDGDRT